MKRAFLLKVVNVLLFLSILWQAGTGFGHRYIPYHIYVKFHFTGGILLVILVLIHVWLNWSWIKNTLFKSPVKK